MSWSLPAHVSGGCTGTWRLSGRLRDRIIRCTACCAEHTATAEARRSAIEENRAGLVLRRLTAEGNARLDSDPGRR